MNTLMQILSPFDVLALVVFVSAWLGYEMFGERAAERGANLSGLMQGWRGVSRRCSGSGTSTSRHRAACRFCKHRRAVLPRW